MTTLDRFTETMADIYADDWYAALVNLRGVARRVSRCARRSSTAAGICHRCRLALSTAAALVFREAMTRHFAGLSSPPGPGWNEYLLVRFALVYRQAVEREHPEEELDRLLEDMVRVAVRFAPAADKVEEVVQVGSFKLIFGGP